jgi:hypothetical protein
MVILALLMGQRDTRDDLHLQQPALPSTSPGEFEPPIIEPQPYRLGVWSPMSQRFPRIHQITLPLASEWLCHLFPSIRGAPNRTSLGPARCAQ